MTFLAELRRRNVIRVAGLYLVGAWLGVQIAETLLPIFKTPDWVLQALVVLLALGFVPALVFAWVFEMTPQGLRRESEVERSASTVDHTARRLDIAVIVLLLALAGMMLWGRIGPGSLPPGATATAEPGRAGQGDATAAASDAPLRSIAVLAFDDLSAEQDQAYFAEGVSEELLNVLARIDGLQVAARTSSFKFKEGDADIGEIGRALGVDVVLEGSVRKSGDQMRITAQLIKVSDGFHLWSQSYDRKVDNIFAVQDEIATAIVDALKLQLDLEEETAGRTANVAAYDLYLRGRHEGREPTREGLLKAIGLYEEALALDDGFADAYGGIAEAWIWLEDYGGFRGTEAFPQAEQAARRALRLDPQSVEAKTSMAMVHDRYYNDQHQAAALFEDILATNPNHVIAYNLYADALMDTGEARRAVEVQRRAVELDPLSVFYRARLAGRLLTNRRPDEAEQVLEDLLRDSPGNAFAEEELASVRRMQGRLAEAAGYLARVHADRPGDPFSAAWLAILGLEMGDDAMADAWVAAARARGADNRWELLARRSIAEARGDTAALDVLASASGGHVGAHLRALAAIGRGQWAESRKAANDALRLSNYRAGQPLTLQNVAPLILLAWLDQREGRPEAAARLAELEAFLGKIEADGGQVANNMSSTVDLARVAAVAGDRERSLGHLRVAMDEEGFRQAWVIERDPVFEAWRDDAGFKALAARMRALARTEHARVLEAGLQQP
jgi:TolB-like protein/cytochrome c-type biogenesis protein CcmH/NrfG